MTTTPPEHEINPSTTQIAVLKTLQADVKKLQAKKEQEIASDTPIFDALRAEYTKKEELLEFFGKEANR
jgi:hypothetical protein